MASAPVATFSVDVDTGAYANARRFLNQGIRPPAAAVLTEEFINYFRYAYPAPADRARPFSVTIDASTTPWNTASRIIRIGFRGYNIPAAQRPPANLVFLVDVSGSMGASDKLPLVQQALRLLTDRLNPSDRVSIFVYAGAAGLVLEPTADKAYVKEAVGCLEAGGSTAGGEGLALAYKTARSAYIQGGINRVILATDGDFNVGATSDEAMMDLVKSDRDSGVTLTTLGFGEGNYNESMMEKIADVGNGNYAYIDGPEEADKVLSGELSSTLFTIAQDVKIQVEFNPAAISQYRLIGYENRALAEQDFTNDKVDAGDIGAGHQVTALYEVIPVGAKGWLPGRRYPANQSANRAGVGSGTEAAWVKLRYKLPDASESQLVEQPLPGATLAVAGAPVGDQAFALAVAAFGQILRGETNMNAFTLADVIRLAGTQSDPRRAEFVTLVTRAQTARPQE